MKNSKFDVSYIEDLIPVLANMVALEEHLQNTSIETKDNKYLEMASAVRRDRSILLEKNVKEEGEIYCSSKHICRVIVGLKELSSRKLEEGNEKEAKELLELSLSYEKLFIQINGEGGENV